MTLDFVRDSPTPDEFDGWWQVWKATVCIGYVRKSDDPVYPGRAWGYKTKGAICEAGFRTRQDAAEALLRRFVSGAAHTRTHANGGNLPVGPSDQSRDSALSRAEPSNTSAPVGPARKP